MSAPSVTGVSSSSQGGGCRVDLADRICPECEAALKHWASTFPLKCLWAFTATRCLTLTSTSAASTKARSLCYTEELFGKEQVFRASTRYSGRQNRLRLYHKYLEQTNASKRHAEINRLVSKLSGVRRTTGQHPGVWWSPGGDGSVLSSLPSSIPPMIPAVEPSLPISSTMPMMIAWLSWTFLGHDDQPCCGCWRISQGFRSWTSPQRSSHHGHLSSTDSLGSLLNRSALLWEPRCAGVWHPFCPSDVGNTLPRPSATWCASAGFRMGPMCGQQRRGFDPPRNNRYQ